MKFSGGEVNSRSKDEDFEIEETDKGDNHHQTVLDIRRKYEKKLAARGGDGTDSVCPKIYFPIY